jgi:hypothetical protein
MLSFWCDQPSIELTPNLAIQQFRRGGLCSPIIMDAWLVMYCRTGPLRPPMALGMRRVQPNERAKPLSDFDKDFKPELSECLDINMRQVRNAADWSTLAYQNQPMYPGGAFSSFSQAANNSVFSAMIGCADEVKRFPLQQYVQKTSLTVGKNLTAYGCGISNLIGIPLMVTSRDLSTPVPGSDCSNIQAVYFDARCCFDNSQRSRCARNF